MTPARRALVVCPSPDLAEQVLSWLERAGFTTIPVPEFLTARAAVDTDAPDIVVTELKLGSYNGLHLAIRLRSRGSKTPVIVIGDADPVLETEAERAEAAYVRTPAAEAALLAAINQQQPEYQPARRSPRKPVPLLEALVDAVPVRLIDVSYEGLRFQVLEAQGESLPQAFVINIPTHNVRFRAERVWMSPPICHQGASCGAMVLVTDAADAAAWRALVDSVPARPLTAN